MEINGNGQNGAGRDNDEVSFGPFKVKARQLRAFYALTYAISGIIIGFAGWHEAVYGDSKTWGFVIVGMLRNVIQDVLTGTLISLAIVNAWEAIMGQFNPFEGLGVGQGPKWLRRRAERLRHEYAQEYANERVAEATAVAERDKAEAVAEAEARGREIGRREAEEAFKNGDSAVEDVYC